MSLFCFARAFRLAYLYQEIQRERRPSKMRFYNWQEMYDILAAGTELYNPKVNYPPPIEVGASARRRLFSYLRGVRFTGWLQPSKPYKQIG